MNFVLRVRMQLDRIKLLRLIVFIISFNRLAAQVPAWAWATEANSTGQDIANGGCYDPVSGCAFIGGSSDNNLSAYYGPSFTVLAGKKDAFVAKYSPTGTVSLAFKIGSVDDDETLSIATDPFGNIYICGYFENTLDFDPSAATFTLTPSTTGPGKRDGFLAKYSPSGNFTWAVKMGGAQDDECYKVYADSNGVYVTGYYNSPAAFYSTSSASLSATASQATKNMFGAKYNASGVVQWVISGGSTKDDIGYSVLADKNNVYFTGIYNEAISFYSASGTLSGNLPIQNNNKSDAFIVAYTQAGAFGWATNVSSSSDDEARGLAQDASSLYVAGIIGGTASFPYPSPLFTRTGAGGQDIFAAKLNKSNGVFQWASSQTGSANGDEGAYDIEKDASGNLWMTGFFKNTLNFTSWSGPTVTSVGAEDIFVTGLDPSNGNFLWVNNGGGPGRDVAYSIAMNQAGVAYVAGEHKDAAVFGSYTLTNAGGSNIVLAKLGCSSSAILNNTIPSAQTICSGSTPSQLIGSTPAGGTPPYTYLWQKSADSITWVSASGTNNSKDYSPPALTGNSYFRRKVISSSSCDAPSYSAGSLIRVDPLPSIAHAASDQTLCASGTTISAIVPVSGTGIWSVKRGGGTVVSPGSAVSQVTQLSAGSNAFVWTVSSGVCPISVDSIIILVDEAPTPADAGVSGSVCSSSVHLNATAVQTGSGQWSVVSGSAAINSLSDNQSLVSGLSPGANVFRWTTSNGSCPTSSAVVTITRDLPPTTAVAENDKSIDLPVTTLSANKPMVGTGQWSLISGSATIEDPGDTTTSISAIGVGNTVFRWTISNGSCASSSDDVTVYLAPLLIPGGFSPNGDQINDHFEIPGITYYPGVVLTVYNRWGNIVYQDHSYKNSWEGTNASGENLVDDTYYFTLSVNEAMDYKGYVVIKRDVK